MESNKKSEKDKVAAQVQEQVFLAEMGAMKERRKNILLEGEAALRRLLPVARRDTGQSGVIARFLLSLYNGDRFPFDLSDFRRLDDELVEDCLLVVRMDAQREQNVYRFFKDGEEIFERMAADWGFKDWGDRNWRRED